MTSIEEIDTFFNSNSKKQILNAILCKNLSEYFSTCILSDDNIVYLFDSFQSFIERRSFNVESFSYLTCSIIQNPTFKTKFLYDNPHFPWDFFRFNTNHNISSAFILTHHAKSWNFCDFIQNGTFTYEELEELFRLNQNFRYFFHNINSYIKYLTEFEEFNFNIFTYPNYRYFLNQVSTKYLIEHPNFEMSYAREYPDIPWDFSLLCLSGKMTMEEAIKFLKMETFKSKILKYFDNLMIQRWMNSWFIKRYIKDDDDRIFYLRKIKSMEEGRVRSKNEELKWELIHEAMSPEKIFYWYLDTYDLDNDFQDVLPDNHPRKIKSENVKKNQILNMD